MVVCSHPEPSTNNMSATVEYRNVTVRTAAGNPILDGISLSIRSGESVAFLGRSGAGKTTALKLLNGLIVPSSGEVLIDGSAIRSLDLIALRRSIGYVIQGSGLFPHRTVFDNIATVPRLLGWPEEKTRTAAEELTAALEIPLGRFGDRFPRGLSGGEQQRVGIARALISEPRMLLCDEPFAALDPILRREQQDALIRLRQRRPTTVVFVTHDLAEAMRVADRLALFDAGAIVADTPAARFATLDHPLARRFVSASRGSEAGA